VAQVLAWRAMWAPLKVDVSSVDRTQFKVTEEDGEILILPFKTKYRWRDDELHLRSLVLDRDGNVRSAGFPKFFNLGERPALDAGFAAAMARGQVELPEKLDGSLIVADRIAGSARLRTRGSRVLGGFAAEIEALIAAEYPRLIGFLEEDPLLERCSLAFEFVSPTNTVVLRQTRAQLVLLGYVDKQTIAPGWDASILARVEANTGVSPAPCHPLPDDLEGALAEVRGWRGREGVVARFVDGDGTPRLIKIKAEDYLRLHAYQARLGGTRARRVVWLLDLRDESQLLPALARYGLDWEAAEYARAEAGPYLAQRHSALVRFEALAAELEAHAGARKKSEKRAFVDRVRDFLGEAYPESWWFSSAMKLFDAGADEARLMVEATLLDEPVPSLRAWRKDPDAEVRAILTAVVREEDG
jgi:hypothetical protein